MTIYNQPELFSYGAVSSHSDRHHSSVVDMAGKDQTVVKLPDEAAAELKKDQAAEQLPGGAAKQKRKPRLGRNPTMH